ncbi:MAG: DUF1501 domain-containing protein [Gemmataceae bacterium]|nr:DUF1501 domain-containing protein [Gemmataceae bacterium]
MLHVGDGVGRTCHGPSRRAVLTAGGLGLLGVSLADAFRAKAEPRRRDISCIVLWLDGGPSHLETFDPKPAAPEAVRGPYGVVQTPVPGVLFSELMPQTAARMGRCALIRSLAHQSSDHFAAPMLTGSYDGRTALGAVVAKLRGPLGAMPAYVRFGSKLGVGGGTLGTAFDPLAVADPAGKKAPLPDLALSANVPAERFRDRAALLSGFDAARRAAADSPDIARMGEAHRRAADLLTSDKVREALDVGREPEAVRDRYGANLWGASVLTARRLVEAGTRFVEVKWYDGPAFDGWDVHGADLAGMTRMEQHLCPRLDQTLSALLDDLHDRGLLDTTLVAVFGEFGRTPAVNKYGARDHWPYCFSVLLAGGGVPAGMVYGGSDTKGAYPAHDPVSPAGFAATVYKLLGVDVNTDPRVRPFLGAAQPVADFF